MDDRLILERIDDLSDESIEFVLKELLKEQEVRKQLIELEKDISDTDRKIELYLNKYRLDNLKDRNNENITT